MTENLTTYLIRLLVALLVGGLIGLEREFKGKPAGIRTNMLMCIGSAMIMIISIEISKLGKGYADPGRIAAQVVTGIGFLGAGTIIRSKFHITGLTTAATIWVLSALGLAIGAGYITLAVIGAVFITITLTLMRYIEDAILRRRKTHILAITLTPKEGILLKVLETFTSLKVISEALEVDKTEDKWSLTLEYTCSEEKHSEILNRLSQTDGVMKTNEL